MALSLFSAAVVSIALFPTQITAHGIATAMVRWPGGIFYRGYDPSFQYQRPPPVVIGWSIPDDLTPSGYGSPDMVCHLCATPGGVAAPVQAGDTLEIQWNKWPASHKGPVLDYLARCESGPCEKMSAADKTKLRFFKISEAGLVDAATGLWAADQLLANNLSWSVRLPTDIAPGNYVLRHEMMALHAAGNANGAQNYPFCFNLAVSSNGTARPAGVPATALYKATDPGVLFDLFRRFTTYVIPGPPLYTDALAASQTKPGAILATGAGISNFVAKAVPAPTATAGAGSMVTPVAVAAAAAAAATTKATATTSAATWGHDQTTNTIHTMVRATLQVKREAV